MSQSDSRSNRHPLKGLLQIINEDFDLEEMNKIRDQWFKAFAHAGTMSGRFQSSAPNVCSIPKEDLKDVDYGDMELRVMAATFPGADGIGPDVDWDFQQIHDELVAEKAERPIGANPCLGVPYGLAADILKNDDVIFEQLDPYNGHRVFRAKILRFDPIKDSAEIEFEDKKLIPPTMWVKTRDLRQAWGGRVVNTQTHCPKCEIPWKETMLARFSVWDCPTCGAKKEDHAR